MIGEQLRGHGVEDRRDEGVHLGKLDGRRGHRAELLHPRPVGQEDYLAAPGDDLLHVGRGLVEQIVGGRDHDDRHVLVDQGDGPVLHLAGGVAFGVDVAELLELERALQRDREAGAPAEIEHVPRFGHLAGERGDALVMVQDVVDPGRQLDQGLAELGFLGAADRTPAGGDRDGQAGQGGELGGERLGRGDPDLGPGLGPQHGIGLARHRALVDIDQRDDPLVLRPGVAERGQGVRGLARLRHE